MEVAAMCRLYGRHENTQYYIIKRKARSLTERLGSALFLLRNSSYAAELMCYRSRAPPFPFFEIFEERRKSG